MVKHFIFWTFSDKVNDENKQEVLTMMSESVKGLVGKISGLISAEIGENYADSGCDFVFYAEFENKECVSFFQNHPLHLAHKERSAPFVKDRMVADYEI